jgi:GT2 family glycosyltransferase
MQAAIEKEPVYILIPVYNRKETTLACLQRLEQTGALKKYHTVVIDDASTDGTAEAIKTSYPETLIVPGDGDLWWTGAIALGMNYAAAQQAEYFIWLNDDCVPVDDTLFQLVAYMRNHPNTIAAPTCYAEDTAGHLIKQHNAFVGRRGFAASAGEVLPAEGLSGWCVGIPRAVFDKIGVPDVKKFPHYSGDDTYIYRATRAGFSACVIGDLSVQLLGKVHPKLDFRNHFNAGATPMSTFHSLFLSKRSPYLLTTRFFYFIERYGPIAGSVLFTLKLGLWIFKWSNLQLLAWLKPHTFADSQI